MIKEIEIKVQVENTSDLVSFLETNGQYVFEHSQIDEYFTPAHKNYLDKQPVEEWFRIRQESDNSTINYKKFDFDETGRANHSNELEVNVSNPEEMRSILNMLGFQSIAKVDKIRKVWLYQDYEIAFDQVKGLGDFIEVEYKGVDEVDSKLITDDMVKFLKEHGCGKLIRNFRGYPYMLLFPENQDSDEL